MKYLPGVTQQVEGESGLEFGFPALQLPAQNPLTPPDTWWLLWVLSGAVGLT